MAQQSADTKATSTSSDASSSSESSACAEGTLTRGIKAVGEVWLAPGSSLILDGKIVAGGAHLLGALLTKGLIGPLGVGLIAANSYSKSVSGKHLHEHFKRS
jgi:hypothetical protein